MHFQLSHQKTTRPLTTNLQMTHRSRHVTHKTEVMLVTEDLFSYAWVKEQKTGFLATVMDFKDLKLIIHINVVTKSPHEQTQFSH